MDKILFKSALIAFLIFAAAGLAEGKSYRPVSIHSPDYVAEVPENTILPDVSKFELAVPPRKHPNDPDLIMILYKDISFRYFDETNGEEIFPYMEVIKKEKGTFHLVTVSFINKELKIELYEDRSALAGQTSDRLEKYLIKEQRLIRKVPR